ncbi:hypothetical protein Pmani_018973 [Petrolisthes manimaculis]|uniref:Uncharacterized protein n=1 Tax=Petrolisthes manimaculis TaxID=1843537 RepID=A0AAE1U661_9EUCA|nr:hypothetical protein Pmani_018973 [Petrolisthes manimaculis]
MQYQNSEIRTDLWTEMHHVEEKKGLGKTGERNRDEMLERDRQEERGLGIRTQGGVDLREGSVGSTGVRGQEEKIMGEGHRVDWREGGV